MRILSIGTDRSLFDADSAARQRHVAYAKELGTLDVIVFTVGRAYTPVEDGALRVIPTSSLSRFAYGLGAIMRALSLPRPDVVTAQDPFETGLAALFIARLRGVPLHVQVHTDFLAPAFALHSRLNRIRRRMAGFVLRRSSRIRVVSERLKQEIIARYRPHAIVHVLPIFADTARFKEAKPLPALETRFERFAQVFLFVGRLEPEKGAVHAIRVFAQSAPQESCLILVGQGSERVSLEREAAARGVKTRVFFEGERDPAPYYALADLVLVPSAYEGYGLVIVEALAAGVPVLATDVGIAREAGAIVAPVETFPAALTRWLAEGPRHAVLRGYPYESFPTYVGAWVDDVRATAGKPL